jgi:hypothetical protein
VSDGALAAVDAKQFATLEEFQEATGQDLGSLYAAPGFVNAPVGCAVVDVQELRACSDAALHLAYGGADTFMVGDNVEVNFDGVPRRVGSVEGQVVTIEPPLAERPSGAWVVVNWGENSDLALDLGLLPASAGATLREDGGAVGSSVDIQAYLKGDFDGDGRRDVPALPHSLHDPRPG